MAKIISHDSHHVPVANAYDIAMVKLKRPSRLDRAVNLACLPQSGGRVKNRKHCWVTGRLEEKNVKAGWGEIIAKSVSEIIFGFAARLFKKGLVSFTEFCTQARFRVLYTINLKFFGC